MIKSSNNQTKLITNASQLLLCASDTKYPLRGKNQAKLQLIENAAVLMQNDMIIDFGDSSHLENLYSEVDSYDACHHVVMPGLVDPHTHLVFAGSREDEFLARIQGEDYLSTLNKGKGILYTVEQTRKSTENELYLQAKDRLYAMLSYGTTSFEAKSGYGLNVETELTALLIHRKLAQENRMLIPSTLLAAHALPKEFINEPDQYLRYIANEILPLVSENKSADFMDVFCEKNVFSAQQSLWILEKGKEYGLKPKLHTDEFYSIGGIQTAIKTNAVSADHLMKIRPSDIEELSQTTIIGVILPGTGFNMSQHDLMYPRRLMDGNVPVAIGSDFNPGTCMCWSMQMMMELSVLKMGFMIEEAIHAATINAAFACGIAHQVGSIAKGKKANLMMLDVDNYKKIPYFWGINKVQDVVLNGEFLDF